MPAKIEVVYSSSPASKAVWKELVGSAVGFSARRWYNKAEIIMLIVANVPMLSQAIYKSNLK